MIKFTCEQNTMYPNGKWEFACPKCGHKYAFFLVQPVATCSQCGEQFPEIRDLAENAEARFEYHTGGKDE